MTRLAPIGWGVLALATLAVIAASFFARLPDPDHAIVLDHATYVAADGEVREVTLPRKSALGTEQPGRARYLMHFDLAAKPAEPLLLYIPSVNRRVSVILNGEPVYDTEVRALWSGPLVVTSVLINLPRVLLASGRNELTVTFDSDQRILPEYLSAIYLGAEVDIVPNYKLHIFVQERLRTVSIGAQILLGLGVLFAFFCRPQDPLFGWLAALIILTSIVSVGLVAGFLPDIDSVRSYAIALLPGVGFVFTGVALILVGSRTPKWLRTLAVAVPGVLLLALFTGLIASRAVVSFISMPLLIGCFVVATVIIARGAFRKDGIEARLMLVPFSLMSCFVIRDIGVSTGILDGVVLLAPYARPFFLASLTAVLMWRLAASLGQLDDANEHLNLRLRERERELDALHRKERSEAARLVREQERQRLTRDLHDGISGHLVSIIAMSERPGGSYAIEQAARQALDDLRLVIYSLDLGDTELPLALANFRERLIPQLQRIGVDLDWSTADLPEVSGVTPANALAILRILQEAITNALKHGPATKITIRGAPAEHKVALIVENDGQGFIESNCGLGLENMRRRASQLRGEIQIRPIESGTRLTLLLPHGLPDVSM